MAWAVLWVLVVAVALGVWAAWLTERPVFVAHPNFTGALVGFAFFCGLSTCVPVFVLAIPLSWNWPGVLLWEGVVALGMGVAMGSTAAAALRRRVQRP